MTENQVFTYKPWQFKIGHSSELHNTMKRSKELCFANLESGNYCFGGCWKLCDVCQCLNYVYKVHFFAVLSSCIDELVEIKNGLKSVEESDTCRR